MFGLTTSMRTDSSHVARRALRAAAAIAGLAVVSFCAPGELHAQRFQQLHGSTCYDFGTSGVPVSTGGYISVGPYTPPTGGLCGTSGVDVYVVRLRANGSLAWSRTYNIGYNDETQDVKECANGDFIIVGSTDATTGCIGGRDIFALRIDSTGNVLWTRLYGTSDGDEDAFEVVETTRRPGRTSIGDFVIAGSQRNASDNTGDAYIIRITSSGTLLWGKSYNISTNDHLYAVDESRVGTSAGDIIAAGVTTVPGPLPGQQTEKGILMRVSGADGSIGAAPQGVATYGGNVATTTRFLSVEELTVGTEAGRIVAAGHSTVVGVGADHYIVKTAANPCSTLADVRFGKDSASAEEAWCVREIRSNAGGGLNNGNLIVSGHGGVPIPGGPVSVRAVLFELSPSLTLVTPPVGVGYRYYGAGRGHNALHVEPVVNNSGVATAGFYLTGIAEPPSSLVTSAQMYLIKTDNLGVSGCNDSTDTPRRTVPEISPSCLSVTPVASGAQCEPSVTYSTVTWIDTLCNDSTRITGPIHKLTRGGAGSSLIDGDGIEIHPNPASSGAPMMIRFTLAERAMAIVTVSDMAGRVRSTRSEWYGAGITLQPIETGALDPGTYVVAVTVGGHTISRNVVVSGR